MAGMPAHPLSRSLLAAPVIGECSCWLPPLPTCRLACCRSSALPGGRGADEPQEKVKASSASACPVHAVFPPLVVSLLFTG